jgi:hypothetical protein
MTSTPDGPPGRRLAGAAGIVFAVLSLAVIPLSPEVPPPLGSGLPEIAAYYTAHRLPFMIGNALGVAAFLPGLVQLAFLAAAFRRAEGQDGWLWMLVLSSGAFTYAVATFVLIAFQTVPFLIRPGDTVPFMIRPGDDGGLVAITFLANAGFSLVFLAGLAFILSVIWATLSTGVLPRWFAHAGVLVAISSLVQSAGAIVTEPRWLAGGGMATMVAFQAFFVWLFALGVIFLIRSPGTEASSGRT